MLFNINSALPTLVREGEDIKKRGFAPLKHPFSCCPGWILPGV